IGQVLLQARGRADHHRTVHPVLTGTQVPPQTGGTELQRATEPVLQLGHRTLAFAGIGRIAPADQLGQFGGRVRIRIGLDPLGGPAPQLGQGVGAHWVSSLRTISANSAEIRGPASLPAATTSSWLNGSSETPAARFVTRDRPSTSRPACRAAIASSAVDMPTRSPPMRPTIATSAGVS